MRPCRSFTVASAVLAVLAACAVATSRPIIGVLAQDLYSCAICGTRNQTYIAASYVKFIEQAGARVAPIFVERDRSYYVKMFNSLNGILLPGGDVDALDSSYGRAGAILTELAMEAHKNNGTHFPVWGTCLGLELLARVAVGGQQVLKKCDAQGVGMPLHFAKDFRKSQLYRSLPKDLEKVLSSKPVTYNAHYWCLTLQDFEAFRLGRYFKVLSTNNDLRGVQFVSTLEAISAPVFAVQFHPEMAVFEWGAKTPGRRNLYHSKNTALFSQYLANFFVEQARQNNHRFQNADEERRALIYNYQPLFTQEVSYFTQMYVFN